MSRQNSLASKRLRRAERANRKAQAAKRIPFVGRVIDRKTVLSHRYRAVHGLEFSSAVAAVAIAALVKMRGAE